MRTLLQAILPDTLRAALLPAALFAAAFAGVAIPLSLAFRAQTPMPDMIVFTPKLEAYRAAAADYDTVFIGTSRTFYHIVPEEVEAGAALAGCPGWRVINLGVFGLTGYEQDWLTGEVLKAGDGKLQRVIIEDPLPNTHKLADATTDRARYFHGPEMWPAHMASIASYPESLPKRVFRAGMFVIGAGFDLSGVGRGSDLMFPPAEAPRPSQFDMSERGFEALGSITTPDILARRAEFENDPAGFDAYLARYGAPSNEDTAQRASYLADRLDRLSAAEVTSALYISPDLPELDRTPRTGEAVRALPGNRIVLNFNRPDVYPDLFERDLWYDFSHFGEAGARALSRLTGEELCAATGASTAVTADAVR